MNAIPADGVGRLLFFVEDRLAQLRWTREDLAGAGGPAPSTLYKAAERGGGLSVKTLARLDVALGWQEGSAKWTLGGGSPALRISEQVSRCALAMDAARFDAESTGVSRTAAELEKFLLDVAQRLRAFYTGPVRAVGDAADVSTC
ncbi:XRE family transcriptional regulator [Mycobacterium avium]|uniref:XRE family transcriptional regulator n=1 Tax=Mycobacterium avium TaxID=1764 RepID=UPI000AC7CCA3|nr:XRE family transcriptional regulator [Mycobacterium avium]MBZ4526687.1 XRE family transcriptional regulator [Mycobacterium avium subsp. hominissuis]MBZ4546068.1 XRE family transcriptional regulator [Mycobacterium avium subsp. hominissuis]MBZ4557870.1 XRE family transcriptional regulator [Mycobacterium avium subsp. hominissuis]MBZ4567648.1 XRE family transcriptional regulator [Mycobacterium avium subsp. hominissuis]MBZ4587018.1 XRE family transcriptional regulator [Mycobacterium avium subsp.